MSNLIESMIHENHKFSESKKAKKTTDKKVVKEGKGPFKDLINSTRIFNPTIKGDNILASDSDKHRCEYDGQRCKILDVDQKTFPNGDEIITYKVQFEDGTTDYVYEDELVEEGCKGKKKKVKESVDGTDEIYVIVSGGMIEDVFTTNNNLDVSVIDLDVEYDDNLYQDVIDRYERNELKNAYVYYQFESLKGKKRKKVRESYGPAAIFEEELLRIFGKDYLDGEIIHNRSLLGKLDADLRVRIEFVSQVVRNQYRALKVTLFNRKDGVVDQETFSISKILGRNNVYIWDGDQTDFSKGEVYWYGGAPSNAECQKIKDTVSSYIDVWR